MNVFGPPPITSYNSSVMSCMRAMPEPGGAWKARTAAAPASATAASASVSLLAIDRQRRRDDLFIVPHVDVFVRIRGIGPVDVHQFPPRQWRRRRLDEERPAD